MTRRPGRLAAVGPMVGLTAVLTAMLTLTACTGVPTSSPPEIIKPVRVAQPSTDTTLTPTPNADQRQIISEFLAANAAADEHHTAARAFLTPEAKSRWTDSTVTIVSSDTIGNYSPSDSTVTVTGQPLGSLDSSGEFTPTLLGQGSGGAPTPYVFTLKQNSAGQWRIDNLPNGLLLDETSYQAAFTQRNLYFYNLAATTVVADPRYSALSDPTQLSSWLIQQLVAGPSPNLQSAVEQLGTLAQTEPARVTVTVGSTTAVEIPGSSQLDDNTRDQLAEQIALTLAQVEGSQQLMLTDGGRPVTIPAAKGTVFNAGLFAEPPADDTPPPLYFIRNAGPRGEVVDDNGMPLSGGIGSGQYGLTSVALAHGPASDLFVAGTSGPKSDSRLLVGTLSHGLQVTSVRGALTRPAWAPGLDEVWVGVGSRVVRLNSAGSVTPVTVTPATGIPPPAGQVTALRLSPDGARIALVYSQPGGAGALSQLWVGSVVRNPTGQVMVDDLVPISPQGVHVVDASWYGPLKLFVVGSPIGTSAAGVFEVQVDGWLWTASSTAGLPQAPDSITVANDAVAWVSTGGTIWRQVPGAWASPLGPSGSSTDGTNPVYLVD
jgi:hypothetical protein